MQARILSVFASWALCAVALGQSTAFTYQGELKSGGTPASGLHDFRFRLFDTATGGTQVGTQLCADNIQVADGEFTTQLNFGQAFVSTAPRFLEIEVRSDTGLNCANASGFVVLAPRQPVTPAPRATSASVANALGSPDGLRPSAVIVDNSGRVGVGTAAPTHTVHVASAEPTLALQDTDSAGTAGGQQVGYVSYRDNGNVERAWVGFGSPGDPDLSVINARPGGDIVLRPFFGNVGINTAVPAAMLDVGGSGLFSGSLGVAGSVGVGTNSPSAKLDVRGNIRLGSSGQFLATGGEENLRIVRGMVGVEGQVLFGSGFSASHDGTGLYTVTFDTPFTGTPAVTVTVGNSRNFDTGFAKLRTVSPTSASIEIAGLFSNDQFSENFNFIAIGPR